MSDTIHIEVWTVCYVCNGKGFVRLNHAASASCWACHNGEMLSMTDTQIWTSFERCLADKDPFQNGAHTTWPLFMIDSEVARYERRVEDSLYL